MTMPVENQTRNRDWELTLLYLFRDLLPVLKKRKDAGAFLFEADPSWSMLERSKAVEFFRKIGVFANWTHDMISIDQSQVLRRIHDLRTKIFRQMELTPDSRACRIFLRIDDFPSLCADSEEFLKFHRIAAENRVSYLLAATPFLERKKENGKFSQREIEILKQCGREGMEIALHGFTHRRRAARPASELAGMPASEVRSEIDRSLCYFNSLGFFPRVFVAPFNTYDPSTLAEITARFAVFCGGPETIHSLGARMPSFFQGSFYQPSYRGVYDLDENNLKAFEKIAGLGSGCDLAVTLHWTNEVQTGFKFFREFCRRFAAFSASWSGLIADVDQVKAIGFS